MFKDYPVNKYYTDYVSVGSGGKALYTWQLVSGAIPPGLSFHREDMKIYLKGYPSKAGSYFFILKVSDANGAKGEKSFWINITSSNNTYRTAEAIPINDGAAPELPRNSAHVLVHGLRVVSDNVIEAGSGCDEGIVYVKAGDLTLKLEDYTLNGSKKVYVNDELVEGITFEEGGTFTVPAELVVDGVSVQVKGNSGVSEVLNINVAE